MKHANIAIFVPHNGCPHQCSFCDQRAITGERRQPTQEDVRKAVESYKGRPEQAEIAFFGGSFTAIPKDYMHSLLEAAYSFVKAGKVSGIRFSTRPDAIDEDVLELCKSYGVTSIELGAQSMDDEVLKKNARGHTAMDVEIASCLIRSYGFSLGLQMMTGLWGDTPEKALETAEKLSALKPDTVRIYPTVVLPGTMLAEKYAQGVYAPQTLSEAVELCAELLQLFHDKNIPVIRMGLHDSPEVKENRVAGPYHPAFRELCESRMLRKQMEILIGGQKGSVTLAVNPKDISKALGQKKENVSYFEEKGVLLHFHQEPSVKPLSCRLI